MRVIYTQQNSFILSNGTTYSGGKWTQQAKGMLSMNPSGLITSAKGQRAWVVKPDLSLEPVSVQYSTENGRIRAICGRWAVTHSGLYHLDNDERIEHADVDRAFQSKGVIYLRSDSGWEVFDPVEKTFTKKDAPFNFTQRTAQAVLQSSHGTFKVVGAKSTLMEGTYPQDAQIFLRGQSVTVIKGRHYWLYAPGKKSIEGESETDDFDVIQLESGPHIVTSTIVGYALTKLI